MSIINDEEVLSKVTQRLEDSSIIYQQLLHKAICSEVHYELTEELENFCCEPNIWRIFPSNDLIDLPVHRNCDCYYKDLETMPLGTVSERKPSPDIWLKLFGKLPDYYITKEEAMELGWRPGKNTIAG
ncbi:MAG: hypothetical protein IJX25_02735, partial [Clostridia bacterium]|nr:hypothetical protein [Clostridia bacterium]